MTLVYDRLLMYEAVLVARKFLTQTISDNKRKLSTLDTSGRIARNSYNELQLDTSVYLQCSKISRGSIPFVSANSISSNSSFKLINSGHLINAKLGNNADLDYYNIINVTYPVNRGDTASKSYLVNLVASSITSFVTLPTVITLLALPSISVVRDLVMMFLPTIKFFDVGASK